MLRMALQTEKMIRKSHNIFHIRKPGAIRRAILGCVTATLYNTHTSGGMTRGTLILWASGPCLSVCCTFFFGGILRII